MVSNEVFRGRYRQGFEHPEPIPPGEVLEYSFSLHTQDYTFRKGHRIMVQVQSTWFPFIDRNPQTFVPNIMAAKESDFRAGGAPRSQVGQTPIAPHDPGRRPGPPLRTEGESRGAEFIVAATLTELEPSTQVRIVSLPGLSEGDDIEQWIPFLRSCGRSDAEILSRALRPDHPSAVFAAS